MVKEIKGHIKIHAAVDTKTKEILALGVADEKIHDGNKLCDLIDKILKQNNNTGIKTVLADGAYGSNKSFNTSKDKRFCRESG